MPIETDIHPERAAAFKILNELRTDQLLSLCGEFFSDAKAISPLLFSLAFTPAFQSIDTRICFNLITKILRRRLDEKLHRQTT